MKRSMKSAVLATACGLGALAGNAVGEVIFDNFNYTQGEFMYGFLGYSVNANDPNGIPDFAIGQTFVVSGGDYTFDNLIAPILYSEFIGGINAGLTLSLYTNSGDGFPGTLLEEATFSGLPEYTIDEPVVNFEFSGTTVLEDGARYWITATVPDDGNFYSFGWVWNFDDSLLAPYVISEDGGPWQGGVNNNIYLPQAAFRVEGTLVPAPGVLTGLAAFGLIGTRRRRG